jgi:hypothetical protein
MGSCTTQFEFYFATILWVLNNRFPLFRSKYMRLCDNEVELAFFIASMWNIVSVVCSFNSILILHVCTDRYIFIFLGFTMSLEGRKGFKILLRNSLPITVPTQCACYWMNKAGSISKICYTLNLERSQNSIY